MEKYKLTDEKINFKGHTLYRIEALKDFGSVKKGEKGGYIENYSNLSYKGKCWIHDSAKVFENSRVCSDANVYNNAWVFGKAVIYGNVKIFNDVHVFGNARIADNVEIFGHAKVYGNSVICQDAVICEKAKIYDDARVCNKSAIGGNAEVFGEAEILGRAEIVEDAKIYGKAQIYGGVVIRGDAIISSINDYIVFKNFWSSGRYFTWTRSNNKWSVGCFYGTSKELIEKAYNDSEVSGREYERVVKYVESLNL